MSNQQIGTLENTGMLKFLGVQGGGSTSHTNAYFYPDEKTLAFIDLSLLNVMKARKLLEEAKEKGVKRIVLCLTHTHDDHASGVVFLAFSVREIFGKNNAILEVITSHAVAYDASRMIWSTGGRTLFGDIDKNERDDEVCRLFSIDGEKLHYYDTGRGIGREVWWEGFFERPKWLLDIVPTSHSPRLMGACGFVFKVGETVAIYSGDTNNYSDFEKLAVQMFQTPDMVEFYLDVKSIKIHSHLYWRDIKESLCELYRESGGQLKLFLMHYDNPRYFKRELVEINSQAGTDWAFLAKKEF